MSVLQRFYCIFGTYNLFRGIRVDSFETDAITKMLVPHSLTELQRFFGMVNYLGKFIPNLAEVTAPLRVLLKKDVVFNLVRRYWKVENFDYVSSHSKNFWFKLTNKIKNRCKFWRIMSTPRTKLWPDRKPTMASNSIFVRHFTWLQETICSNWKRDSLYSFLSRTFPPIFILP